MGVASTFLMTTFLGSAIVQAIDATVSASSAVGMASRVSIVHTIIPPLFFDLFSLTCCLCLVFFFDTAAVTKFYTAPKQDLAHTFRDTEQLIA